VTDGDATSPARTDATAASPRLVDRPVVAAVPPADQPAHQSTPTSDESGSTGAFPDWFPPSELLHLVYLSNLLWQPIFDPTSSWVDWAIVGALVVLFLPLYVASHHRDQRIRQWALVATVVLGTIATLVNVGASVLFVYAAAAAAWAHPRRLVQWQLGLTGLCGVLIVVSPIPWPFRLWGMLPSMVFLWLIGRMVRGDVQAHREAERLRIDNVRIEQLATADERERIARDLHDLVGQSLTSLVVQAQLVQSLVEVEPAAAVTHAADLEVRARDALAQVRAAIDGLAEVWLDDEVAAARRTLQPPASRWWPTSPPPVRTGRGHCWSAHSRSPCARPPRTSSATPGPRPAGSPCRGHRTDGTWWSPTTGSAGSPTRATACVGCANGSSRWAAGWPATAAAGPGSPCGSRRDPGPRGPGGG